MPDQGCAGVCQCNKAGNKVAASGVLIRSSSGGEASEAETVLGSADPAQPPGESQRSLTPTRTSFPGPTIPPRACQPIFKVARSLQKLIFCDKFLRHQGRVSAHAKQPAPLSPLPAINAFADKTLGC